MRSIRRLRCFVVLATTSAGLAPACLDIGEAEERSTSTGGTSSVADASWDTGSGGSAGGGGSSADAQGTGGYGAAPDYLPDGRIFDQQLQHFVWSGPVSLVTITHKDETSLPASEGGASCSKGCTEQVTRIDDGGSVWGRFQGLTTFSFQAANITDAAAGTAVLEACGLVVDSWNLNIGGATVAGFVNLPSLAWPVPTLGECKWEIKATGGYVLFRAVTATKP
jgi:hypothetical protein